MGINKILIIIIGLLLINTQNEVNCLNINSHSYKINLNETISKDEILKEIKEHYLQINDTTNNTGILNEEVLNNTIEELTDLSNDIETKLNELKKKEVIFFNVKFNRMDLDKKNIGVFASITMIALVLLFYLGVAHMEDALKDATILYGEGSSPQNVIFDPRW